MEDNNIELQINEATGVITEVNLPCYYKYRYTFAKHEQDLDCQKNKMRNLVDYIKQHYICDTRIIAGLEHFTKGMLSCKPHVHIHFISKHKADTIRKGLMRRFDMIGRVQSCKAEVLVDEAKFWRYPLKQQLNETSRGVMFSGFNVDEIKQMVSIANACWKQSAEVCVTKLEKKLERTGKDRLFAFLETVEFLNEKQFTIEALRYYAENEETFCCKTIKGYVHVYMLLNNKISYNEFYDKYLI